MSSTFLSAHVGHAHCPNVDESVKNQVNIKRKSSKRKMCEKKGSRVGRALVPKSSGQVDCCWHLVPKDIQ